jgi:hypothetical protein
MAIGVPQRCGRREARRSEAAARVAVVSPAPRRAAAETKKGGPKTSATHATVATCCPQDKLTVPADSQHHYADLPAPFPGDDQRKLLGPRAVSAVRGLFNAVSGRRRKRAGNPGQLGVPFGIVLVVLCCDSLAISLTAAASSRRQSGEVSKT